MKQNIIFFHLESLNMIIYQMNRNLFPNLRRWEELSISFERYYSTATSTYMVQSDIAYGEWYMNEESRTMVWENESGFSGKSLFDELEELGYRVKIIACPASDEKGLIAMNKKNFVGKFCVMEWTHDVDDYHKQIDSFIRQERERPFCLWLCSGMSHVENNIKIAPTDNSINRWSKGFVYIDKEAGLLYELLQNERKLTNTTVIFYGDHGDDVYTHGLHMGLTHALPPYFQMIHTPLFIYDKRMRPTRLNELISSRDLRNIALKLLGIYKNSFLFKDLRIPVRKYIYSRNMYAAQRVREKSFGKAYCICDGLYLLLVDSTGISMYREDIDPTCHNNLLNYFVLNESKLKINDKDEFQHRFHFKYIFDVDSLTEISSVYNRLIYGLKNYVKMVYEVGNCSNRMYEMDYEHISLINNLDRRVNDDCSSFEIFPKYFEKKRVVLYGAGEYGKYCFEQIKNICNIIAWVDKKANMIEQYGGRAICSPSIICELEYDVVYIAILNDIQMQEAYKELRIIGVDINKII